MTQYKVTFQPQGLSVSVDAGCNLLQAQILAGLRPDLSFLPLAKDSKEDHRIPISLYWRKGDFMYSDMQNLINCIRSMKLDILHN